MALALNKSSLKQQQDQLKMFQRFLPSLDLKRQQLMAAYKQARDELAAAEAEAAEYQKKLDELLPLLGSTTLPAENLLQLVHIDSVVIDDENVLGTIVPVAREVRFRTEEYSTLVMPFWVDLLVEALQKTATLRVHLQVRQIRATRLNAAVRRITQRVNLFDKVLIPGAQKNIQRIRIFLSDEERAAVVRSKIAKRKHQKS